MSAESVLQPTVPSAVDALAPWARAGMFGAAEVHGAEVLTRHDPLADPFVQLGAAFALWAPLHGHACVDLGDIVAVARTELARMQLFANPDDVPSDPDYGVEAVDGRDVVSRLPWPRLDAWVAALASSTVCRVVDGAERQPVLDERPLVLSGHRLYTQRQWFDECTVATALRNRAEAPSGEGIASRASQVLLRLLASDDGGTNAQLLAAERAATALLTVIVGGPGTGKTHTVAQLLAVLLADAHETGRARRIALAAPTGKAASRMTEAVGAAASAMGDALPSEIRQQLATMSASTIHRLLGPQHARTRFKHDPRNPLPADFVIIDEASMVALPLMARLLEALRPDACLVLVGDPDQLQSIEVGTVLADVVRAAARPDTPIAPAVVRLARSHRQRADSPIGPLADAIRENRPHDVLALLRLGSTDRSTGRDVLTFIEHADPLRAVGGAGIRDIVVPPLTAAHEAAGGGDAVTALAHFAQVRVLCAHRRGPFGVDEWNRTIESWLLAGIDSARPPRFYAGRPLLATRNDFRLRISNGDTGIVVNDPVGVRAAFATGDTISRVAPAQLDSIETAYAMTIHKSQGSEYGTVVVVLPPAASPLIGRELLYTAVTRTTDRLVVVGTADAVVAAVSTPGLRVTGLADALVN